MGVSISQKSDYLLIEWAGKFEPSDLGVLRRELPQWQEKLGYAPNVLHTFDKLDVNSDFQPLDAFDHTIKRKSTQVFGRAKSAMIAKTEDVYKVSSLFSVLNRNPNIEMRVFSTEAAALAWLREEQGTGLKREIEKDAADFAG